MTAPTVDPVAAHVSGRRFSMLIGGRADHGATGALRAVHDPSTGATVAEVPEAAAADVDRAVSAAQDAQPHWAALGLRERIARLNELAGLLAARREELAFVEAIDTGNPLPSAERDLDIALAHLREWPAIASTLTGRVLPVDGPVLSFVSHHPYGVVARIAALTAKSRG